MSRALPQRKTPVAMSRVYNIEFWYASGNMSVATMNNLWVLEKEKPGFCMRKKVRVSCF